MAEASEQFVKPEQVFAGAEVANKREALEFLAQKGADLDIGKSSEKILQAFLDREKLGITGMVDGLAIPHAKSSAIDAPAVCLAKFAKPVEWDSMDDNPVTVAVALYVPDAEAGTTHVKLLSKVAVLASRDDFGSFISSCDDLAEIAAYLSEGIRL